jgi:phosphoribosyl-ATP pyrophosphohydrolase
MAKAPKKKLSATVLRRRKKKQTAAARPPQQEPDSGFDIDFDPAAQLASPHLELGETFPRDLSPQASPDVLNRLWSIIASRKDGDPNVSHSARLLARGTTRVAQKLGEEAAECVVEIVSGNRAGVIGESADLLYHLLVAWVNAGITPQEIWQELEQRERVSALIEENEGPLKRLLAAAQVRTTKIP